MKKVYFPPFLFCDSLQKTVSTSQPRLTFFNSFQWTLKSNWPARPATQDNCENLPEFWQRKMKEIGVPTLPAYWHPDLVFKNPFLTPSVCCDLFFYLCNDLGPASVNGVVLFVFYSFRHSSTLIDRRVKSRLCRKTAESGCCNPSVIAWIKTKIRWKG